MLDKDAPPEASGEIDGNFCQNLGRDALKVYATELLKLGVDQTLLSNALKNIWPNLAKSLGEKNATVIEHASSVSAALEVQEKRKDFIGRVITHEISALLPLSSNKQMIKKLRTESIPGKLPREIIPGFVSAIKDMFGDEFKKNAQKKLTEAIERTKDPATGLYDWTTFYTDADTHKMTLEIFNKIKECIDNDKNKFAWLKERIESSELFSEKMKRSLHQEECRLLFHSMFFCLGDDKPKIPF